MVFDLETKWELCHKWNWKTVPNWGTNRTKAWIIWFANVSDTYVSIKNSYLGNAY